MKPLPIIQWDDYPEAETMETRKVKKWNGGIWFFGICAAIVALMFLGNWIISLLQ